MKIELWAKRTNGKGHVFLNEVDVPDNFGEVYKIPVRQPISVILRGDNSVVASSPFVAREFVRQRSFLDYFTQGGKPKYLEV